MAAGNDARDVVRQDVHRLVHRGLDLQDFTRAVSRALRRAVPFDGTCLLTIDPATMLPTGDYVEHALSPAATVRLTEIELREPDLNKFVALARGPRPAASLSEATHGDLELSRRQRELRRPGARLPVAVRAVAGRARAVADGNPDAGPARVRVGTPAGRWLVVRGSLLHGDAEDPGDTRVAVMLEPARPPELAPLIADAYGFTPRERLVTELVARGCSTNEIAARLHLSAYTVQDHLKSIFHKSGTGSRGDLVARLFFDHYLPRL